jgi:hypothetical protein
LCLLRKAGPGRRLPTEEPLRYCAMKRVNFLQFVSSAIPPKPAAAGLDGAQLYGVERASGQRAVVYPIPIAGKNIQRGEEDMNRSRFSCLAGIVLGFLVLPMLAVAQNSVKCESNNGRRNYCGQYGQAQMERQISGSPCIEGRTWGVDQGGLWVDRGCRAYFTIRGSSREGGSYRGNDRDNDDRGNNRGNNGGWWQREQGDTWPPRGNWRGSNWGSGGACFYNQSNFTGNFFCLHRGEARESLAGYGDEISSVRTFGGARVDLFDDRNFNGARERVRGDVGDLRALSVRQKPGHTWNNRVSSVRVR